MWWGVIGLTRGKRPVGKTRGVMYFLFVILSFVPWVLVWVQESGVGTVLLVCGAAELAFGFYAFTTGNATNSLVPALPLYKRKETLKQAQEIIQAGRLINIGAVLLILAGVFITFIGQCVLRAFVVSAVGLLSTGLVSWGAVILCKNASFGYIP